LFRVLAKYATAHPVVGYCQGFNFIVGFMLLISGGNEVETYYLFQSLIQEFELESMYSGQMTALKRWLFVFTHLFTTKLPNLQQHFTAEGIDEYMWVTKWVLTLFVNYFPKPTVVRLWDCIFVKGLHFIF
jgi:hypothetical protein